MDLSKNKIDATLVFLVKGEGGKQKTFLPRKVKKLIVRRRTGLGGSLDKRETPRTCAMRELYEESGLVALKKDLEFKGVMTFHNQREKKEGGGWFIVRVYIFILNKWRGKPKLKKSEVIDPRWYKTYRLPIKEMPPSDRFWVPALFGDEHKNEILRGEAWHSPNQKKLLGINIKWVGKTSDVD